MEKPIDLLKVFSPLLIGNHIRMLTIANCLAAEDQKKKSTFYITKENYNKITEYGLQKPLIGIVLQYDENTQKLTASIEQHVYDAYTNKIMHEVAMMYKENYFHRYDNFIRCEN